MKLDLVKPAHYDEVAKLIDTLDWNRGDMIYLIVISMDTMLKGLDIQTRDDLLRMILSRYYIKL